MKFTLPTVSLLLMTILSQSFAQQTNEQAKAEETIEVRNRTPSERITFLKEVAAVYFKEKDYTSAVTAYERILQIDPDHEEAKYVIGHVYISAKQYAKAEKQLKKLAKEKPDDFSTLNNLAWLYATAEDPLFRDGKKALITAQKALVLSPYDHHIWSTLSEAHYINGNYEKAYRAIEQMARLATGSNSLTKEQVAEYNNQINKCKRAWDAQKMLEEEE